MPTPRVDPPRPSDPPGSLDDWRGHHLGARTVAYSDRDAMLYALAVGATPDHLDLVFEERLLVLPTFAMALAQWAPDALVDLGAWDPSRAVHGSQSFESYAPLPPSGSLTMRARVGEVFDTGRHGLVQVEVEAREFRATWSVLVRDGGGYGGPRPPGRPAPALGPSRTMDLVTGPGQAALYRLLGDRHRIHIDPGAARAAGLERPILHGLCSLAAATLPLAREHHAHAAELSRLEGRFVAPVYPGEHLVVSSSSGGRFEVAAGRDRRLVIANGRIAFGDRGGWS